MRTRFVQLVESIAKGKKARRLTAAGLGSRRGAPAAGNYLEGVCCGGATAYNDRDLVTRFDVDFGTVTRPCCLPVAIKWWASDAELSKANNRGRAVGGLSRCRERGRLAQAATSTASASDSDV